MWHQRERQYAQFFALLPPHAARRHRCRRRRNDREVAGRRARRAARARRAIRPSRRDRGRRRRLRRLDRVAPAQARPQSAAAGRLGPGPRPRLFGRRIPHDAHRVRPRRNLHALRLGIIGRMAVAVGPFRPADLPSNGGVVLLRTPRAVRHAEHRGASARRHSAGSARPRGAGEALSAGRLGRRRARPVRARSWRADGAPRGADVGAGVRGGGRRVSTGCDRAAEAGCVVRLHPDDRRRIVERVALRVRVRAVAAEGFSGNTRPADFPDAAGSVLLRVRGRATRASCPPSCPAGPTSTTATSTTGRRIWKRAASRSRTTSTARRSIRTAAIACRARRRSPKSASS